MAAKSKKTKTENSPEIKPETPKEEVLTAIIEENIAESYKKAYDSLFEKLSPEAKERVVAARTDETLGRDYAVSKFVRDVINLAENPPKVDKKVDKEVKKA